MVDRVTHLLPWEPAGSTKGLSLDRIREGPKAAVAASHRVPPATLRMPTMAASLTAVFLLAQETPAVAASDLFLAVNAASACAAVCTISNNVCSSGCAAG